MGSQTGKRVCLFFFASGDGVWKRSENYVYDQSSRDIIGQV